MVLTISGGEALGTIYPYGSCVFQLGIFSKLSEPYFKHYRGSASRLHLEKLLGQGTAIKSHGVGRRKLGRPGGRHEDSHGDGNSGAAFRGA